MELKLGYEENNTFSRNWAQSPLTALTYVWDGSTLDTQKVLLGVDEVWKLLKDTKLINIRKQTIKQPSAAP